MPPRSRLSSVGAALALVTVVLTGCEARSAPPVSSGTPSSPAHDPDDIAFLSDMTIHHSQAIVMAELARTRARNPSVKALADRIRVGQQPEIDAMRATLTTWGVPAAAHEAHHAQQSMPGMASPAELAALGRASGTAFDKLFLRLMIRHHQGAVTMSRALAGTGQDERTGELAEEIGIGQTKEIATMRKLQGTL